jgi:hypothetical protein
MSTLPVLVDEATVPPSGTLGAKRSGKGEMVMDISTEKLRASLGSLSEKISGILQDIKQVGDFNLKTVEIEVAISAEGGFVLVGKAGVKGAVTLTFSGQ